MRIYITAKEILPGMIVNLEKVTTVRDNGAIWITTEEDIWKPLPRDYQLTATI